MEREDKIIFLDNYKWIFIFSKQKQQQQQQQYIYILF
jgi:hypothetical protein